MRPGRLRYRSAADLAGPTGSVITPANANGAIVGSGASLQLTSDSGRPGLILLALLVIGLGGIAYWTR